MADPRVALSPFPVPPPSAAEAAALAAAARFLGRSGTRVASRLLGGDTDPGEAALLGALRDQLLAGAALCEGLLDLAADAAGAP